MAESMGSDADPPLVVVVVLMAAARLRLASVGRITLGENEVGLATTVLRGDSATAAVLTVAVVMLEVVVEALTLR